MKKIILLFVMMLAFTGVQAKKDRLYASFGTLNNTNIASGNLSFTATSNANMVLFSFTSGELANYSTLHFKITKVSTTSGAGNLYRLQFRNGSTELKTTDNYTTEDLTLDLSTLEITLGNVTDIRLLGPKDQTSVITLSVKDVYLEKATDNECMSITTTINSSSSKNAPFAWELGDNNPIINARFGTSIESSGTALFGSDYAGPTNGYYFDVTGYDYAISDLTAYTGGNVRYFNNDGSQSGVTTNVTTYIALSGTQHITTIKGGLSNSNSNAITVSTIDFVKDFAATSATAFSIAASTSSTIDYDRTFTVGQASTVCLPFSLTSAEIADMGNFYYLNNVTSGGELQFNKASNPAAYTPYIFVPKKAKPFANLTNKAIVASSMFSTRGTVSKSDGNWKFQGTMAHVDDVASANSSNCVYGWSTTDGSFKKAGTGVSIDAFRAYIIGPASEAARLNVAFSDEETTGIETINREPLTVNQMYNLQGQRVSKGHKGLVIKNGRKYVVK